MDPPSKFRQLAEEGDAKSQYDLGFVFYEGQGVPQDFAEALRWFRKAAEQGYLNAEYRLAVMHYLDDNGVDQNYAEAAYWFRKAAHQGHRRARFFLADMLRKGQGVPQD